MILPYFIFLSYWVQSLQMPKTAFFGAPQLTVSPFSDRTSIHLWRLWASHHTKHNSVRTVQIQHGPFAHNVKVLVRAYKWNIWNWNLKKWNTKSLSMWSDNEIWQWWLGYSGNVEFWKTGGIWVVTERLKSISGREQGLRTAEGREQEGVWRWGGG